jgi:invasion protein IalB
MKTRNYLFLSLSCFAFSLLYIQNAQSQQLEKSYNTWSVYTGYTDNLKLCYMVSPPTKKKGNYKGTREPCIMVTNINGKNTEVSTTSGYRYNASNPPRIVIDGEEHKLGIVQNQTAWFKTDKYDAMTISKMKKGKTMTLKATSKKGVSTVDTYSLKGFTSAYNKITELCKK